MSVFHFIANSKCLDLEVTGKDEHDSNVNKYWVLSPFVTNSDEEKDIANVAYFQQNTEELRGKVSDLVKKLATINPQIHRLRTYFESELKLNEWFFLAVDETLNQAQIDQILIELLSIDADEQQKEQANKTLEVLQKLRSVYDIKSYGEFTKEWVGEPDKQKRVCRYCHRSMPEVSFKKVAHTISEALGNKSIKTNDECDECNQLFGDTIEQDFLSIFDIPRLFFGIKKKNGFPHKFVGDNYTIEKDDIGTIKINYRMKEGEQIPSETDICEKLMLTPNRSFPEQNIYKALCKYVYGVLDDETLKSFERTREWLIGKSVEPKLPKLSRLYHPQIMEHPRIMLYVRKPEARNDLPHVVAEIRIINLAFIVILPFSDKDICLYETEEDYMRFWHYFDIYSALPDWSIGDCNGLTCNPPKVALNIKPKT